MSIKKIILVIQSRLFREMLNRALGKVENLIIVQEINSPELLPEAIEQTNIDWVVIYSEQCHVIPDWVDEFVSFHPTVCLIDLTMKGNRINLRLLNNPDEKIEDISLKELITLLEEGRKCQPA